MFVAGMSGKVVVVLGTDLHFFEVGHVTVGEGTNKSRCKKFVVEEKRNFAV